MSDFRRDYLHGGCYFFTVVTHNRFPWLQSARRLDRLREAFRYVRHRRPFELNAIVVLPDHLHCIWTMTTDPDYSTRWQMIKTHFSRFIRSPIVRNGTKRVWQPRFWEHRIRDDRDYARHMDYIHFNPVKHGYVNRALDWPQSSIHRYIKLGWYAPDWGATQPMLIRNMDPE